MINLLLSDFIFFIPFIFTTLISIAIPVFIIIVVIKNIKKNKNGNLNNEDILGNKIKNAITSIKSRNICDYCGSKLSENNECPNCGATKK